MRNVNLDRKDLVDNIFIAPEKIRSTKKFVKLTLLDRLDWRQGFKHFDIYNRLAYKTGLLDKLEIIRRDIGCHSAEELIDILYVVGYSQKRIVYLVWKFGYDMINRILVSNYIGHNRKKLAKKREEFMQLILDTKNEIFQEKMLEIKEAERKTVEIYLRKIDNLQELLENTDPCVEIARFNRVSRQIENIQLFLNKVQGIDAIRTATVELNSKAALATHIHAINNNTVKEGRFLDQAPERAPLLQ